MRAALGDILASPGGPGRSSTGCSTNARPSQQPRAIRPVRPSLRFAEAILSRAGSPLKASMLADIERGGPDRGRARARLDVRAGSYDGRRRADARPCPVRPSPPTRSRGRGGPAAPLSVRGRTARGKRRRPLDGATAAPGRLRTGSGGVRAHPGRSAAETGLRILAACGRAVRLGGLQGRWRRRDRGPGGCRQANAVSLLQEQGRPCGRMPAQAGRDDLGNVRGDDGKPPRCRSRRGSNSSSASSQRLPETLAGRDAASPGRPPSSRGCRGHPGAAAARDHKARFEGLLAEAAAAAGIPGHASLGRRLMIVVEGALSQGLVHHDPSYALAAGSIARDLVASARSAGSS